MFPEAAAKGRGSPTFNSPFPDTKNLTKLLKIDKMAADRRKNQGKFILITLLYVLERMFFLKNAYKMLLIGLLFCMTFAY
jgi:hypothetical protein